MQKTIPNLFSTLSGSADVTELGRVGKKRRREENVNHSLSLEENEEEDEKEQSLRVEENCEMESFSLAGSIITFSKGGVSPKEEMV